MQVFHNEAQDYQDELFGKAYYFCLPDNPSEIVAGFIVANASTKSGCRHLIVDAYDEPHA
ncbi:MAG: hypothetical protein IJV38_11805 [Prevotella sp.]|nr:hypothetical protein [Prevotella sp.]